MKKRVSFGFVGCGSIAKKHYTAISRIPNAVVSAVCDVDSHRARSFSEERGIPYFREADEMCKNEHIDVLCVLTPSGDHGQTILKLIRLGKHFVVEKPLALNLNEVDEVLQACDKSGLKLFVVQQNRYNPPIQAVRDALDGGRFGKLVLGTVRVRWCRPQRYYDAARWRGTWAYDGGVLTNQASHHIDMLLWLMGEAETVMAKTATQLVDIEAEDTGVAIIRFRNGALGVIEATTATRPKDLEGSISILGEKGAVEVGGFFMNELKTWKFDPEKKRDGSIFDTHGKVPSELAWNHQKYLENVIQSFTEGTHALVDGLEGRKSIELINALYESAETGREVPLRFRPSRCKLGVRNG